MPNPSTLEREREPLTAEQVIAEPAGPRLNQWVAEHVMKWTLCEDDLRNPQFDTHVPWTTKHNIAGEEPWRSEWGEPPTRKVFVSEWRPSTDIAAAWAVREHVRRHWLFSRRRDFLANVAVAATHRLGVVHGTVEAGWLLMVVEPVDIARAALLTTLDPRP